MYGPTESSDEIARQSIRRDTVAERPIRSWRYGSVRGAVRARRQAIWEQIRRVWLQAGAGKYWYSLALRSARSIWLRARAAWVLSATGAFTLALAGMFSWMSWHSRQIVLADTYTSSSNLALSVGQFVARTMETVDLSLRVVVEEIGAGVAITPQEVQALLAERVRQSPEIISLVVAGSDGHVRFSSDRLPHVAADVAGKSYFTLARDSASLRLVVGDAISGPRGTHVIFVSRRFNRQDGKFAGVVVAALNPDYVQRFFSTLHVGQHGIIALDTADGTLLVQQPYREDYVGRNFGSSALFREMLPWASTGVFPQQYDADKLWRIAGYQRLEKFPLVVQVALSVDEALADWRRTTIIQADVGAAILLVFALMALILNRELQARVLAHGKLRETVSKLEEASRAKSQFLANMSHELRTPLNAVIGYSEILLEDAELDGREEQRTIDLRRINNAAKHLLSLVTDVLDLSKIEAGKMELSAQPFDADSFIDNIAATCRQLVVDNGNEFTVQRGGDLGVVIGDATKLRQCILNLVSNAAKFTKNGVVTIRATRELSLAGDWICIAVRDTGIGISREDLPKLFQNFSQATASISSRYGGTGLGLALSQKLCRMLGGQITVESELGRGSCFTVRIPATPTAPSRMTVTEESQAHLRSDRALAQAVRPPTSSPGGPSARGTRCRGRSRAPPGDGV